MYSQLHNNSRVRTWIVFGLLRASLLVLRTSAISHSHHSTFQNWAEDRTCSRLLTRTQKTAKHPSSDGGINICSAALFFYHNFNVIVSKTNLKRFYVRDSGSRSRCLQNTGTPIHVSRLQKSFPKKRCLHNYQNENILGPCVWSCNSIKT